MFSRRYIFRMTLARSVSMRSNSSCESKVKFTIKAARMQPNAHTSAKPLKSQVTNEQIPVHHRSIYYCYLELLEAFFHQLKQMAAYRRFYLPHVKLIDSTRNHTQVLAVRKATASVLVLICYICSTNIVCICSGPIFSTLLDLK